MNTRPIIFSGPMVRALLDGWKTQTRRVLKPQPEVAPLASEHLEDHELRGWECVPVGDNYAVVKRLPYTPGDLLWVREAFTEAHPIAFQDGREGKRLLHAGIPGPPGVDYLVAYRADGELLPCWHANEYPYRQLEPRDDVDREHFPHGVETGWNSPIHMPRKASRLTLRVTDVRVQRVQEICEEDAEREGISRVNTVSYVRWFFGDELTNDNSRSNPRWAFSDLWNALNAKKGFGWDTNPWVAAVTFHVIKTNRGEVTS